MSTKSATKKPSAGDIRNLLEPIEVAIALGGSVEAPVGSTIQLLQVFVKDLEDSQYDYNDIIGIFPNIPAAEAALRDWILIRWHDTEAAPWKDDEEEVGGAEYLAKENDFMKDKTDKEIIKEYFGDGDMDDYLIKVMKVEAAPARGEYSNNED